MKTILADTNIFIRFLTKDNDTLSPRAREIFKSAEEGKISIYLDEVIAAEIIWLLFSFYEHSRKQIATELGDIFSQKWIINPKKDLILEALNLFDETSFSYIDCWAYVNSKYLKIKLLTFDNKLEKFSGTV